MGYNILHLTDLHISNTSSTSGEYLREVYYEEYLDLFSKAVNDKVDRIDALIITGDFIHQGDFEKFDHAEKVLSFLMKQLNLDTPQICLCIGNHDLDRNKDFKGEFKEARKAYAEFSEKYFTDSSEPNGLPTERIKFKRVTADLLYISLDATLHRTPKHDKPGKISTNEIDDIITSLRTIFHENPYKVVLIGSHYPLEYVECPDVPEESDWYEKHFWKSGEHLKRSINRILKDVKVVWFAGDIHQPSFIQKENNLYIVSGRFGTSSEMYNKTGKDLITVESISYTNRQATLVLLSNDHLANVYVLNVFQETHGYDVNRSNWKITEINEFSLLQNQPEVISAKLDAKLSEAIIKNRFFNYEKIVIDKVHDQITLGWVMIDSLFGIHEFMNLTCNEVVRWLKEKYSTIENSRSDILVGLDFWGAIVATNLSVMLNIENIVLPSKGDKETWSMKEHIENDTNKFRSYLKGKKQAIIIADVIATGRSIRRIIEQLQELQSEQIDFVCVALLCDMKQEKKENLDTLLKAFGTCCGSFRLPMFSRSQLPPLELMADKFVLRDE